MKMKTIFAMAMAAIAVIAVGCNKSTESGVELGGDGVVKIILAGDNDGTKSTTALANESAVKNFTAMVFDYDSGVLQGYIQVADATVATVTNIPAGGSKRVVVVANGNSLLPALSVGTTNYSFLDGTTNVFTLEDQKTDAAFLDANGLIMTGEASGRVFITSNVTSVTVPIKRIVSKVVLNQITISPAAGEDITKFTIGNVSIQRAASQSNFSTGTPKTSAFLWGGIAGNNTTTAKTYLKDALTISSYVADQVMNFGNFFYVLPNTDADNCTMLTLECTYTYDSSPQTIYFPVKVNYKSGSTNTDGSYISRNKIYNLNLTIENLSLGTGDPDTPATFAAMEVTVTPMDWDTVITQDEVL